MNYTFEHRRDPLLPFSRFLGRVARHILVVAAVVLVALVIGILGYHYIARFSWIDSILNASMILTGMGPVGELKSTAAKLFASAYALFSGLIFITSMGVILAPVLHRVIHKFHVDADDRREKAARPTRPNES